MANIVPSCFLSVTNARSSKLNIKLLIVFQNFRYQTNVPLLFFSTFFLTMKTTAAITRKRAKAYDVAAKVTANLRPNID